MFVSFNKIKSYHYLGLDMAMNDNINCVFCKNKTSGAHSCGICLKPCHAIPPCASSIEEKEEGFGGSVTCGICAQNKPMSDSEVENLSDDIEEGPLNKKKKNCYSIDKKLEAIDYAKKHSMHETARHFKVDRKRIREWISQEGPLRMNFEF
jgi:hypothetical protein